MARIFREGMSLSKQILNDIFNSVIIREIRTRYALEDWWRMPEHDRRQRRKHESSAQYSTLKISDRLYLLERNKSEITKRC